MDNKDDEKLRELMHQMTDVPFSDGLSQRIIEEAANISGKPKKKNKLLQRVFRFGAVSAGLVAAAAFIIVALGSPAGTKPGTRSTAATNQQSRQISAYGMKNAPIQIENLHIGEEPGYPKQSEVIATLTNRTSTPIHASDVFGILAFSKEATLSNLADADWISFVNGPLPDKPILPHQSVKWAFHPVGAPHTAEQALTETPHLMFYKSQLVSPEKADVTWMQSPLIIGNTSVVLNTRIQSKITNGQAIIVQADLKNPLSKPIDLSNLLCFIWFDQNDTNQFTSFGTMRFISHVSEGMENKKILQPGETVHASFHLIGSAADKYFTNRAHIVIVNAPQG